MFNVDINLIKELRKKTGISISECKKALIKAKNDIHLAIKIISEFKKNKKFKNINNEGLILVKVSDNNKFGVIIELISNTDFVAKNSEFYLLGKEIIDKVLRERIFNIEIANSQFKEKMEFLSKKVGEKVEISRLKLIESSGAVVSYSHHNRIGVIVSFINGNINDVKKIAMHIAANKPKYISHKDIPVNTLSKEYDLQFDVAKQYCNSDQESHKIAQDYVNKYIDNIALSNHYFIMDNNKTVDQFLKEKEIVIKEFVRFEIGEYI